MRRLYNNAMDTIERQKQQMEKGLSIGSGYSWWELFLKDLIFEHARNNPEAPVNVSLGNTLRCMDQLLAGDISMFIGHRIDDLAHGIRADFIEIGPVHDGYFVREGHPLLAKQRTRDEVRHYPSTLAFPPEARQQRLLLGHDLAQLDERQPEYLGRAFTSNSLEACLEYVRETDAVFRHTDLMAPVLAKKGIAKVEMQPGHETSFRPVGIYVLAERRADRRLSDLIDIIHAQASTLVCNGVQG